MVSSARLTSRAFAVTLLALCAGAADAQVAGTTGAVNPDSAAGFGGTLRTLQMGAPIIRNEHVKTNAGGTVQIVFIDKTTLSVGPNSDVTIDEFVYDANTGSAKMALTMSKGLLRVVGGQATHTDNMKITTPVATVGVRGGVATVSHDAKNGTKATNLFGTMTVSGKRKRQSSLTPGQSPWHT